MQCRNCGAIINEGSMYCQMCGQKLQPVEEIPTPARVNSVVQPASVSSTKAQPASAKKRKIPGYVFLLGGIFLLLVIGAIGAGVVALIVNRSSSENSSNTTADGFVYDIAYVNYSSRDGAGLYLMDSNGQNIRLLVPLSESERIGQIAWSPDGESIAYSVRYRKDYSISVVNVNTGHASRLVSYNDIERTGFFGFDWSPDGQQIVYLVHADHYEIHMINSDGSQDSMLTFRRSPIRYPPVWSPDGDYIAFHSEADIRPDFQHHHYLSIIRPDGSDENILQEFITPYDGPLWGYHPWDWSPDSQWIITGLSDPEMEGFDIQLVSSDGAEVVTLANYPHTLVNCPRFSPDGRWVAYYTENRNPDTNIQQYQIYIIRPDGSDRQPVSAIYWTNADKSLSWSPDSRSLIYSNSGYKIERVDIYTGQITILLEQHGPFEMPAYEP